MTTRSQRSFLLFAVLVIATPAFASAPPFLALDNNLGILYQFTGVVAAYDSTTGNKLWESVPFPGSAGGIAVDSSTGNVYVAGTSPGVGTGTDYHTVAYDSSGNQLWEARYHGPRITGDDVAYAIAVDTTSGNVYVTGQSWFSQFGPKVSATVAYDFTGNQLWVGVYRTAAQSNWSLLIAVDSSSGNVYATGVDLSGEPSLIDLIAYDGTGTLLWSYRDACFYVETPVGIAVGGTGNVYVTGSCLEAGGAGTSYVTLGFDLSGNRIFYVKYQALIGRRSMAKDIAVDTTTEHVYVTGDPGVPGAPGTFAYDLGIGKLWEAPPGVCVTVDSNLGTVFVSGVAYDPSGNKLWEGPGASCPLADSNTGNLYVLGPAAYDSNGNKLWP